MPRLRAQPGVLVAVVASILLATTLLAVGPVLATAVAEGGLRADLEQAPASKIGIEVEVRTSAARATEVVATLEQLLDARFGTAVDPPDALVTAGTVRLEGQPDDVVTPVAVADGVVREVTGDRGLLRVVDTHPGAFEAQPVHLHADALPALGVGLGDVLRTSGGAVVQVAGTLAPVDPGDRRWWDDPVGRDGVVPGVDFTEVGPLYVPTPQDLEALLGDDPRVAVRVRTLPVLDEVTPDQLQRLGRAATGLSRRVDLALEADGLGDHWTVDAPLADAASSATVALAATRAAVIATVGQVAVLAVYTLGLAGRLLRSGREIETMLLRARGAEPEQLGRAAAFEGLVLVVPAVVAAPWLATVAVRLLARLDVVADAALTLDPRPSTASLGAAVLAGVACLAVLVVPAVTSARRTYATARGARGRRSPIGAVQALGLDLALAAVAGIGIWQLRASGGPLGGAAPRGPGDVDPVLVAAPALGLLAGALLVLRLVPSLARAGEVLAGRVRGLVAGLGGWQVARRPDAVSRPTLLLVLGVAVGVLATTYGATWATSQADQAEAAIGSDVVLEPDRRVTALPDQVAATTLASFDGVDRARPAWGGPVSLVAGAPGGTLIALDVTDPLLALRSDIRPTVPFAELDVAPVRALELPSGDELRLDVTLVPDPSWPDLGIDLTVVVRDGLGLVHRLEDHAVPASPTPTPVTWPLTGVVGPVHLLALDVTTRAGDIDGQGYAGPATGPRTDPPPPLLDLHVAAPAVDGVAAPPQDPWVTDPYESVAAFPPSAEALTVGPGGWRVTGQTGIAGPRGRQATLRIVHAGAASPQDEAAPALVHEDVLAATGRELGDELLLSVSGTPVRLALVGTVPLVPGNVGARLPVLVDLDALSAARWASQRAPTRPTAWHLALDDALAGAERVAASSRLVDELAVPPVDAPRVRSITGDEVARRGDPIAVGLLTALVLGALAAVGLAVLGTVTTAVVGVRERAAEFALLQAVGTSVRQLGLWLAAEVAVVVTIGLVAGGLLGAVLVWAVLPTIALAADGSLAVPAPLVVVPVGTLAAAVLVVVAIFALVPVVLARVVARAHVAEVLRLGEDG